MKKENISSKTTFNNSPSNWYTLDLTFIVNEEEKTLKIGSINS